MGKFINVPILCEVSDMDIIAEYQQGYEIKVIAKRYCLSAKEIRTIIKNIED